MQSTNGTFYSNNSFPSREHVLEFVKSYLSGAGLIYLQLLDGSLICMSPRDEQFHQLAFKVKVQCETIGVWRPEFSSESGGELLCQGEDESKLHQLVVAMEEFCADPCAQGCRQGTSEIGGYCIGELQRWMTLSCVYSADVGSEFRKSRGTGFRKVAAACHEQLFS